MNKVFTSSFILFFLAVFAHLPTHSVYAQDSSPPVALKKTFDNLVYASWNFDRDGDYERWVVHNASSAVSNGFLTINTTQRLPSSTIVTLPNHPINMYNGDTEKTLFFTVSVKQSQPQNLTADMQRVRISYNRSDVNKVETRFINVYKNNQLYYLMVPIAGLDPVVLDNLTFEFENIQKDTTFRIDNIQVMDNYTGGLIKK